MFSRTFTHPNCLPSKQRGHRVVFHPPRFASPGHFKCFQQHAIAMVSNAQQRKPTSVVGIGRTKPWRVLHKPFHVSFHHSENNSIKKIAPTNQQCNGRKCHRQCAHCVLLFEPPPTTTSSDCRLFMRPKRSTVVVVPHYIVLHECRSTPPVSFKGLSASGLCYESVSMRPTKDQDTKKFGYWSNLNSPCEQGLGRLRRDTVPLSRIVCIFVCFVVQTKDGKVRTSRRNSMRVL